MTTKLLIISFAASLPALASVHAQAPVEKPADPPKVAAPAPAVLSDVEKASIDVLALIAQRDQALKDLGQCHAALTPLRAQVRDGQLRARVDSLRTAIEKAHPGYRWDVEKGALVPLPPKTAKVDPSPPNRE